MDAATEYFLKKIDYFVTTQLRLSGSIEDRVKELESEHEMISEVLRGADPLIEQGHYTQVWFQQLRNINYEIESVLDMYAYKNATGNANPWYDRPSRMNHSIDKKMQEIEKKLKKNKEMKEKYPSHPASSSTSAAHQQGITPLFTREAEIVGIEGPRKELASWVLDVEQMLKVMFVVGMGGSGKTTLVKLVYEQLKTDFDCHAWITASEYEPMKNLLSAMYDKLLNQTGQSPSTSSPHDLVGMLINYLQGKRYLIILDNWNREDWESVKCAFPQDKISRVIVTTRRGDLASLCRDTSVNIYEVPPLPLEKARELFWARALPERGTYRSVPGLHEVSEKLLKKCEGLPLGIIEIGRHLRNKGKSVSVFERLESSLQDELKLSLSSISQVLLSSYTDLPHHLKSCFLYMSMFPEDRPVNRRMLIRLWMAEGFITGGDQNEPEDIGEGYLEELMKMNLVHAGELEFDGRPRTCRLHNLMHKIVLSKSKEYNFCNATSGISENMWRVSILKSEFEFPDKDLDNIRTFLSSISGIRIPPRTIPSMKLLKILHLDQANLEALPEGIKKLLLLKYLSVRETNIKQVPISTGRLEHLETLNLKQTFVTELPDSLLSMKKLRHLLVSRYRINGRVTFDAVQGVKVPKGISRLTNLQKLSFVRADKDHKLIQELQNLRRLRKLGIVDLPSDSGKFLCETIQNLPSLRSLSMASQNMNNFLEIQEIKNPPRLQRLYLWGRLKMMPQWISTLDELVRIRLMWSRLAAIDNPITILGKVSNLLELVLLDACTDKQLDFCAGMFPKLKILQLEQMEKLQMIKIDNGALPCLTTLSINLCRNLRRIPTGITNATQLNELHLTEMPPDFVNPLKRYGALHFLVQHMDIYSYHLQEGVWVKEICHRRGN